MKKFISAILSAFMVLSCVGCTFVGADTEKGNIKDNISEVIETLDEVHVCDFVVIDKVEATCTKEGYMTYECACGKSNTGTLPMIEHVHEEIERVDATHEEDGYVVFACACGDTKTNTLPAIEHRFETVETVEATCDEDGYIIMVCECGKTIQETVPAIGHDYYFEETQPTCTVEGTGDMLCKRCPHGYTEYRIPALGHTYTAWTTIKKATGFEEGVSYRKCSVCSHEETQAIPKIDLYPIVETGDNYTLTITREWYENAWVYAAHLVFTDYDMLGTTCANGKYNNGYETTSSVAKRLDAILAVNGCYSAPYLKYPVIRSGVVCNGGERLLGLPGIYNKNNGIFCEGKNEGDFKGKTIDELVSEGLLTDSFCFGPSNLVNGVNISGNDTSRAQRTFMGTNGTAGDVWLFVSDGRYVDGVSAGLTFNQTAEYMISKGCTFGINLDGGGSSTMVYRGHILNCVKTERAVVDYDYFKID